MGSIKSNACITVNNTWACNTCLLETMLFLPLACSYFLMEWTKLCYFTWDTAVFGIPLQFDPEVREGVVRAFSLWPINNGKMSCMYRVNKNSETVKYKFFAVWFFFFLFHLSLLLSILWPSISRFVKPVRLFSSKMVGFRDKKQAVLENQSENWDLFVLPPT